MAKKTQPDLGRAEIPAPSATTPAMPNYLSPRDLAARLRTSPTTVRRLMQEGLPYVKIGERRVRFDPIKAQEWLAKRTVGGK